MAIDPPRKRKGSRRYAARVYDLASAPCSSKGVAISADSPSTDSDLTREAILRANSAFYEAFESGDIDAMAAVWELSDRVACTHPGWTTLRGWPQIGASWRAIFSNSPLQVIVTNHHVVIGADMAFVTNDENLIDTRGGGTVAALNAFVHDGRQWRMVAHHASSVARTI